MKKFLIAALLSVMLVVGAFAQESIELGDFPLGSWLDANYGAVWEFSSGNIRILDTAGGVFWDFAEKGITDFQVTVDTDGIGITFTCEAAGDSGKTYWFKKGFADSIDMRIARNEYPEYNVKMSVQ